LLHRSWVVAQAVFLWLAAGVEHEHLSATLLATRGRGAGWANPKPLVGQGLSELQRQQPELSHTGVGRLALSLKAIALLPLPQGGLLLRQNCAPTQHNLMLCVSILLVASTWQ